MFDLEKEIDRWLKRVRKSPGFEDGDIAEMEAHIRDSVENALDQGLSEEQALNSTIELFGSLGMASNEMIKSKTAKLKVPKPKKHLKLSHSHSNSHLIQSTVMFKNYLKTATRNLNKSKGFTAINILGLALGITCFILISLYVRYELSINEFHTQKDRIFRVSMEDPRWNYMGSTKFAHSNAVLAPTLMEGYSDVKYATRFKKSSGAMHYKENSDGVNASGLYTDNYFLKIFDFRFIKGNPENALTEPFALVITETLAEKLFGDEDPLNQVLTYRDGHQAKVTGIIEDTPENSQIKFDYLISMPTWETLGWTDLTKWNDLNWTNFVLLNEDVPFLDFEKKLVRLIETHYTYDTEALKPRYFLQPLPKLYLRSSGLNFDLPIGNLKYVYLFSSIAFLILLIACMNYINCATARATKRQKEIGVRKTLGAYKVQLIKQFLTESYLVTFLSVAVAIILALLVLPSFNAFVGKPLDLNLYTDPSGYLLLILLIFGVGTISGLYPALMLSAYNPAKSLNAGKKSHTKTRNILVLFQFSITIILIIFSISIQKQLGYVKTKDVGFDRENIVVIYLVDEIRSKYDAIKNGLVNHPHIISLTKSMFDANDINNPADISIEGKDGIINIPRMNRNYVDHDYIKVNGMQIVMGRNFSTELTSDIENAVIINETTAKIAGLENPIGKKITTGNEEFDRTVIGVVKDFHFTSLKSEILPLTLILNPDHVQSSLLSIKINQENINETLKFIESVFLAQNKDHIFDYVFLDESFNARYQSDEKMGNLLNSFSMITIFIAVLGLIGLITYTVEQAAKEIGIRKALGATVTNIVTLLSRNFLGLMALANIIAWPIGYYIVTRWLQGFAYKINLGVGIFLTAGILVLAIALIVSSFQTVKSAVANPVESLRYE